MKAVSTYVGGPGAWHGAIRVGNAVVWRCDHAHTNRDLSSKANGQCACDCARAVLTYATRTDEEIAALKASVSAHNKRGRSHGFGYTRKTLNGYALAVRPAVRAALGLECVA